MKRVYSIVLSIIFSLNIVSTQAIEWPSVPSLPWRTTGYDANGDFGQLGFSAWANNKVFDAAGAAKDYTFQKGADFASWSGDKISDGFSAAEHGVRYVVRNYWHCPVSVPLNLLWAGMKHVAHHPALSAAVAGGLVAEAAVRHFAVLYWYERQLSKAIAYDTGNATLSKKHFKFATWKSQQWPLGRDIAQHPGEVCTQLWLDVNGLEEASRIDVKHNGRSIVPGSVLWKEILQALTHELKKFERRLEYLENFTSVPTLIYDQCVAENMPEVDPELEPMSACANFLNQKDQQALHVFEQAIRNAHNGESTFKKVASNIVHVRFWYYPWNTRIMTWRNRSANVYWDMYRYYLRLRALTNVVENYMQQHASNHHAQPLWMLLADLHASVNRIVTSQLYLPGFAQAKYVLLGEIQAIVADIGQRENLHETLNPIVENLNILNREDAQQADILRVLGEAKGTLKRLADTYRNGVRN